MRETRHGPVLSDLDAPGGPVLAVAMANLAPGDSAAAGLLALNRAPDIEAAGLASEMIATPVQNLLVADQAGIAQFTTGRVPIRRAGDGTVPVDGADGAHDWTGFAGGSALPRIIGPASGRLVNANERIAGPDFPVFMGADWFGDWRARRIRQLLDSANSYSTASFAAMQVDPVSSFAVQILPTLLATQPLDDASRRAIALLSDWHGAMQADLPQPLIFNAWVRQFEVALLDHAGVPAGAAGARYDLVARALSPAGIAWCGGDCGPLLSRSLQAAIAGIAAAQGPSPDSWLWGGVHRAIFPHPLLGALPALGWLTTSYIAQPGDDTTVYRGGTRGDNWASVHGAGYRGVYDLQNLDRSLFALTPGQSGHPFRRLATSLMRALAGRRRRPAWPQSRGCRQHRTHPKHRTGSMSAGLSGYAFDDGMTDGVMFRRIWAWLFDLLLVGGIMIVLWVMLVGFGLLTFGLGFPLLGLLPIVPLLYHTLFVASRRSATPGQMLDGLWRCGAMRTWAVRRCCRRSCSPSGSG